MTAPAATKDQLTSEDIMCLRFFLKAYTAGKFVIDCADKKEANRFRIQLFRIKKKYLGSRELQFEYGEFLEACKDTKISFRPDQATLVVFRTDTTDFMRRMMAKLEMDDTDGKIPASASEKKSGEIFRKLMEDVEPGQGIQEAVPKNLKTNDLISPTAQKQARDYLGE
jgi:hypothetical protein